MAWFAIIIVVIAASGNNIGKVLQKQATRTLPKLTLRQDIIVQYLRSGLWLTGMLTDLGGALLMIVAFAYAPVRPSKHESWQLSKTPAAQAGALGPASQLFHLWLLRAIVVQVSIVQPVSAVGLVVLLIFSHFYLKVRLGR